MKTLGILLSLGFICGEVWAADAGPGRPVSGYELADRLRQAGNAVARARRALKRAKTDKAAVEKARAELVRHKARLSSAREALRRAEQRGELSKEFLDLKHGVRADLNEVRRQRRALKRAKEQGDGGSARAIELRLIRIKSRLKKRRRTMRRLIRERVQRGK